MKRCPQCDNIYDDDFKFCENDGRPLVDDLSSANGLTRAESSPDRSHVSQTSGRQLWVGGAIGTVVGITIGVLLFALFYTWNRGIDPQLSGPATATALANSPNTRPVQSRPPPIPEVTPTPDESPSPEPSSTPPQTPTPVVEATPMLLDLETLSDSPASIGSTSGSGERQLAIHLNDGATLLAEDAWRAPGGIWYRHGGVVSLLEHSRIRSVDRLPVPKPSPASQ